MAILLIVTNWSELGNTGMKTGWFLPELAHPYHVFKEAGLDITFCSPKGGHAPVCPLSVQNWKEDPCCKAFLADNEVQDLLNNTVAIKDIVDPAKYDVIYFAGGHGPMWDFVDNELLQKATADIYEKGGIAASICHGVAGFLNVKLSDGSHLIKGKRITCFTNAEEEIIQLTQVVPFLLETELVKNGAIFGCSDVPFGAHVECDGRIITGQNPTSGTPMAERIVSTLKEIGKFPH